jgi:hypothetical protein
MRVLLTIWFALVGSVAFAQGTSASADPSLTFDHATTGFALTGQHVQARCESCHTQGVFRGTPRDCATCHRNSGRSAATQLPARHIPTTLACDVCHRTVDWNLVIYRHQGVTRGTCLTCHNGATASGKPAGHLVTTSTCDTCHNTLVWTATTYNHSGVVPGTCFNCHNGVSATGKRPTHIPTTAACDTCHTTSTWTTTYNHSGVAVGTCSTCHNGTTAAGKHAGHIPDTRPCDTCHKNYVAFRPAAMDHTGLTGQCSTCHNGAFTRENAQAKSASHVSTTQQCDVCHRSTTTWATATFNHALASPPVTVGDHTCANCHRNGGSGLPMPTNHVPTVNACDTCHTSFTAFRPAVMSHDGTAGQCSACHGGGYVSQGALAKSGTHVVTTQACDTCHSTAAWSPAHYVHEANATRRCSVCHNGITAINKGTTHIPDNRQCDTCHTSTSSFLTRTMDHTGLAGQCSTCHNGAYLSENAQAKSATHTVTAAQCDTCHTSTFTWATTITDHSRFTPPVTIGDHSCATCHRGGGTGLPMPGTHIPTTTACDTCHRNFITFRPATMDHTGLNGQCTACHSGGYVSQGALAKPTTHVSTTAQCDSCHGTAAWIPASYGHAASAVGICSTCHNGTTAKGKHAGHVPETRQCDTCHNNYVAFRPAVMNHTGLAGQCSTCHNGSYLSENAQAKSATHSATVAQCDGCHRSTTTWATTTFNHALASPPAVIGGHTCANCHRSGGSGLPKPTNHIPTTGACDVCHKNFAAFSPAAMDHTGTSGQCSTCHSGGYVAAGADAKPTTHQVTTASCDLCHSTTAWKPATFTHSGVTPGTCATCHGVSSTGKPSGHIPTTQSCDRCHRTTAWLPLLTPYSHTGIAAGSCATCHVGGYTNIDVKPASHIPTTFACDQCHRTSAWLPPIKPYSHTGVAAGTCTTCHRTPYTSITLMDSNHIPTTTVTPNWASCDACHKNYSSFGGVRLHSTVFTSASQYPGTCPQCHEYGNPYGLEGRVPKEHTSTARKAPNSCDNSGCHTVRSF